jgi:Rab family protein
VSFIVVAMASEVVHKASHKMTKLCRKIVRVNVRWRLLEKVSTFRQFFHFIWDQILACSTGKQHHPTGYRRLTRRKPSTDTAETVVVVEECILLENDSNLVNLKISLLGDCQIGKTSFVVKYVGDEQEKKCVQMTGLNLVNKTLSVQGARISFSLWDVGGDTSSLDHVPIACKDAVAILFMFDLTSRCTLNSVVEWYNEARKWNQTAIPILIGTKFDDFVKLPPDLQWTIATQARAYAKAMKATLFFSSTTHSINVNKIFKFITAKLFNLPWTIERNLKIGEPIIDF